jgi:small subunit ribosomal protein S21
MPSTSPFHSRWLIARHDISGCHSVKIEVFDNQIEAALKQLKKQMLKDGLFQEMKRRAHYEKPSVKRKRKSAQARKKRRKAMKRAQQYETD